MKYKKETLKQISSGGKQVYEYTDLPALGFNFRVTALFNDQRHRGLYSPEEVFFQKVSGMNAKSEPETVFSGGFNNKQYKLPNATTYSDLVLIRGIVKNDNRMGEWFNNFLVNGTTSGVDAKTVIVMLMDTNQETILSEWWFKDCYPKSIEIGEFNAQESALAIETLTLCYSSFERIIT